MDSQSKVNIDFKPVKRMKKRKELDALIHKSTGKNQSRTLKHELLRDESNSSDGEEYNISSHEQGRRLRRTDSCCTALIACGVILIILCMTLVVSLVWMYFQLRNDIHILKSRVDTVNTENSELDDNNFNEIYLTNFTNLNKQITQLHELIEELKMHHQVEDSFKNNSQLLIKDIPVLADEVNQLHQYNSEYKTSQDKLISTLKQIDSDIQTIRKILSFKEVSVKDNKV